MSDIKHTITERENYFLAYDGQTPQWVPVWDDAVDLRPPSIITGWEKTEEKIDMFGVHFIIDEIGIMADTSRVVMDDVTTWKEHVRFVDPDTFDWETAARNDKMGVNPDKAFGLVFPVSGGTFFLPLMNMMGFVEGLCAILEEEETVLEFNEYICSYCEKIIPKIIQYYKPDLFVINEDITNANGPFISVETYRKMYKPFFKRIVNCVKANGVKRVELHDCGKCDLLIDDYVDIGITSWQIAQPVLYDLKKIREKHPTLVLNGLWETNSGVGMPNVPEEDVRQAVRNFLDEYAADGRAVFWNGGGLGQGTAARNMVEWSNDEARKYGSVIYRK